MTKCKVQDTSFKFKSLHSLTPHNIHCLFIRHRPMSSLRRHPFNACYNLMTSGARVCLCCKALEPSAIDITSLHNLETFKPKLKTFPFAKAFSD